MGGGNESDRIAWNGRPVWAEIDLDALAANVRNLKRRARGAALIAVVKANAYGHGAVAVAQTALAAGADYLAVICLDEGEQLRRAGIKAPILIMGHTPLSQASQLVDLDLTTTVSSYEMAQALARRAQERDTVARVHIKVDTGLSRYGLPPREAIALANKIRDLPHIAIEALFTHFASADEEDKTYTFQQFEKLLAVSAELPWLTTRHAAATAALLDMPETTLEMVRPGIGIYGYYPSSAVRRDLPLQPILTLKSRVARLTRLSPGESVSYGRTWIADRPSVIALVMCGYADGLPRLLSSRGNVIIRGRRAPIVGRVCMDMCMADVTDIPDVQEEDDVVIIGQQGNEIITADEIADQAGTISYEVLTGIAPRVPRLYIKGGSIAAIETLNEPLHSASSLPR